MKYLNATHRRRLSGYGFKIIGSPWGAYNFLAGTNVEFNGGWNPPDLELAGFSGKNKVSHEEASHNAINIAISRIREDVPKFAKFALTDKIFRLWNNENYAYSWTIEKSDFKSRLDNTVQPFISACMNGPYRLLILLFGFVLAGQILAPHKSMIVAVLPLLGQILLQIFIEVQPRYHMPMTTIMLVTSALYLYPFITQINNKNK